MPSSTLQLPRPSRFTRRLSSHEATEQHLYDAGPVVVVPPQHMDAETEAHEVASAMEHARHRLEGFSTSDDSPLSTPTSTSVTDKYAFAFDIDGVLIRGGDVIPEAIEAMRMLNGQNNHGIKVPYIFVTNGGGKSEQERCIQLSRQLEIEVSPGQFICGHTPMREMAQKYESVLVVGGEGEACREVAEGYGFKDVVTPGDVIKTARDTTPFRKLTNKEWDNSRERDFSKIHVGAIFVFADSRDWAGDQQIILDFLCSKDGVLGTRSENYNEGPPLFFAHNDVVWATSHAHTRIGMGALRKSVEAMFEAITGKKLKTTAYGKPQIGTFSYATRLLKQWRKETHGIDAPPETVYFVGDTPESDIRGTNDYDQESDQHWYSILVRTGVFQAGTKPKYTPKATVDNVLEAVKHGIERERKKEIKNERKRRDSLTGVNISPVAEAASEEEEEEEEDPMAQKGAEIKAMVEVSASAEKGVTDDTHGSNGAVNGNGANGKH